MRFKNALTGYFVAPVPVGETEAEWKELAKWISSVEDDSNEETDDTAFYDGDGTPETTVLSIMEGHTFEGMYDPEDEAMKLIHDLKHKVGDERIIMFKIVEHKGSTYSGLAVVTDIVAGRGGGDASEFATFSCGIKFKGTPKETTESV